MATYLPSQHEYTSYMRNGKTAALTDEARANDSRSHAELNKLRKLPCNSTCFDCTAFKPGWAVLPHGVFVCIECAQTHRNMGRHVSQTKAINTGTYLWYPAELAVMRDVGNDVAAVAFADISLPLKPSKDASTAEKMAYSTAKYAQTPDYVRAKLGKPPTISPPAAPPVALAVSASQAASLAPRRTSIPQSVAAPHPATLARARRQPEPPAQPNLIDLIHFAEPAVTPLPLAAVDPSILELTSMAAATVPVLPEHDAEHQAKKAAVLAHYPQFQTPAVAPIAPWPSAIKNNDAFFAHFGL